MTTSGAVIEPAVTLAKAETGTLAGKVALVTGAGRGLGEALCLELAIAGASVVAADIRPELAGATADRLQRQGTPCLALSLDVADEAVAASVVKAGRSHFGRLDILINNAGVDVTLPIEELSMADWDRIINTNLRGPFIMSRLAFGAMKESGGHIVNIVSTAAKRSWANASAYHASKWGLLGLSHALQVEGRSRNIKVTAVVSGGMRTPFLLERFPDLDPSVLQDPRDVARTVITLLTLPDATFIPEVIVLPRDESSWP